MPKIDPQPHKKNPTSPAKSIAAKPEFQRLVAKLTSRPRGVPKPAPPVQAIAPQRTELPGTYLTIVPPPISAFDDNPVFGENGAAKIVGVSAEVLKKWRQRGMGPDYIQYGVAGPVRYELKSLMEFRAAHKVKPGRKR